MSEPVTPFMADVTTARLCPSSRKRWTIPPTFLSLSPFATPTPPNFITTIIAGPTGMRLQGKNYRA
jgi:hypothetical protein